MFYVGYILSQIPANIVMAKGKPAILLPCVMLTWSIVTICMPAVTSSWAFCFCRFLTGLAEGPFFPAISLMTSSWYTPEETPLRMGIWHAGNIISNVCSGLLATAILTNMDYIGGLHAWQWFFIIEGAVSVLVAIASFWFIPSYPGDTSCRWFNDEERAMAQYRQAKAAGGHTEDEEGNWGGVLLAAKDPFTWLFAGIHFAIVVAQSFKDFFPSVSQ